MKIGSQYFYHNNGKLPRMIFDPDAIVGMDDTPEIRRDTTDRPWSHGNFFDKGFYEARLVTVSGHALATSVKELHQMRDNLVHLFRTGETQWVSFTQGGDNGVRHIRAALGGRISWKQITDTYAQWKFDLYAADPRMYSNLQRGQLHPAEAGGVGMLYPMEPVISYNRDSRTIPNNLPMKNVGNEEAWPVFKIYGPFSKGFSIKAGSKTLTYTGACSSKVPVIIDNFAGTASYNGVDRSYLLTKRDWMSIPAFGSLSMTFLPNIATEVNEENTYVDVEWRSTWI